MSALDRKLFRDLMQMKGQAIAICAVIASGVATFVMALSTLESLQVSQYTYYERYQFADVFAHMKRAPRSLARQFEQIPGVAQVEPRIVADVSLDVPGMSEPAVGRIISVPEFGTWGLNQVHLRSGRVIEAGARDEVMISEGFAEANGFTPGDSLLAVINGRRERLRIVGIVLSPEYIAEMRGIESLPDPKRFGIFWMHEKELEAALDMDGAFNDVVISLMPGAVEAEVLERIDRLIETYGGAGSYGREDQLSHRWVSDEIKQLKGMGIIAPSIFLSVAAFLLNVVFTRLVNTQREQIAALKAFGYSRFEIGLHFLKFVLALMLVGLVVGTALGAWMGKGLTGMYTVFYKFPVFYFEFNIKLAALAMGLSSAAALVGTFGAVRRAIILPPAEAMRPEPPATYKPTVLERIGFSDLLSPVARMVLRRLERETVKAIMSCLGIALSLAVLILGNFGTDAINYMVAFQFDWTQRQDVTVTFVEPTSGPVIHELANLPGVLDCEGYRSIPVKLRCRHLSRRGGISGLSPDRRLFNLMSTDTKSFQLPTEGLTLGDKLAELLDAKVGDKITVEVMEGERPVREVPVTATIEEYGGTNAYMDIRALHRLMREDNTVTGAHLAVDARKLDDVNRFLKNSPRVAGVTVKDAAIESFNNTIAENQSRLQSFNVMFACVIAFGVIYNTARISLMERSRELATLRVIGFTRGEISTILLGELGVLTVVAIPIGMVLGYAFAALFTLTLDSEMFRIPLVVEKSTYGLAAAVTIFASIASGLVVRRRLDHLDLVAVLKSKE